MAPPATTAASAGRQSRRSATAVGGERTTEGTTARPAPR